MSEESTPTKKIGEPASKEERLSSALRENLKRRKAQSRQRADGSNPENSAPTADPASESPEKAKN